MLSSIDIVIISFYFAFAVILGVFLSRRASRGIDDYFLGGRKIPWWVLGASGTASNFDMTGTMIMVSFVFAIGLQGFWVAMRGGMCLPLGLLMIYMGKWLRRSNVMTTAEWMELRFGSTAQGQAARLLSAVANLVVTVAFLTYFVEGTGKFLSVFLGWPPELCALALIAVAIFYTTLSGLYGVIFTDLAQELLMIVTSVYVGYMVMSLPQHGSVIAAAGADWSSFIPKWKAEPMEWLSNPYTYQFFGLAVVFWVARGLFEGAGGLTGGYMPQRYYAARTDRDAGLMTAEWIILLSFRWVLIVGVAVLALWIAQSDDSAATILAKDPEKALPIVLGRVIPAGLKGLAIAGLVAAAMSTFDSTVNAGASYWVRDIYQRYIHPEATGKQLIRQSYFSSIALALGASAVGVLIPNIESIWGWITGPLSAGLFAPVILRWYWARFNGYGFAVSTAIGLVAAICFKIVLPQLELFISFPLTWSLSLTAGIITSLKTKPTDRSVLERFWKKIKPFGLWHSVRKGMPKEQVESNRKESVRDLINVPLAIIWHLSSVVASISLILQKWNTFAFSCSLWTLLSATLYFTWYTQLSPDKKL